MQIRKLNPDGIRWFQECLAACRADGGCHFEEQELSDDKYSSAVKGAGDVEHRTFDRRFDFAKYLVGKVGKMVDTFNADDRRGLWSWLAMFFFRDICPKTGGNRFKPGENPRWIYEPDNFQRYYRHLLFGPFAIYRVYQDDPDKALAVLASAPGSPGELVEQLASRQQIITNRVVIDVARRLYVNKEGTIKTGASSKDKGGVRRFADVIGQFDLTWDLYGMDPDDLFSMLPAEFQKFKKQ